MKTRTYRYVLAALLVGCCTLVSCGAKHAGAAGGGGPASQPSVAGELCDAEQPSDYTGDDITDAPSDGQEPSDTTSDDQGLPDLTSDDDQEVPDETSDDYRELPDLTSETQSPSEGGTEDTDETEDETVDGGQVPSDGYPWYSMTRDFRAYLKASASKADAAVAAHVEKVCVRAAGSDGRTVSDVWVDYGVWEDDELERTARVFARWRQSVYGDHGRVSVLAPAKMTAERSW
ncbi:hypothetical protein [Streptomyces sp. NPDC053069]|uniref:hypothetical protein n=1 Tax=Streptomyces sp. NPDC053069 TaxID=3365695 RepID=UPI0037D41F05